MARRFAILSAQAKGLAQCLESDTVDVRGEVVRDGSLLEAAQALPSDRDVVYVCLDSGHVFGRYRFDREYHGNLMDLMGYAGIAQGYVRGTSQHLVLTPAHLGGASLCLARTLPLDPRRICEILRGFDPVAMTRERFLRLLVTSLGLVGETLRERAQRGCTVLTHRTIFKTIAVADEMALG